MRQVQRMCQVCRNKFDKNDLIRIVLDENRLFIDDNKSRKGKGCYICKNHNCLDMILKKKVFNRVYKLNFDTVQYEKILKDIEFANTRNK